MNTIKCPVCGKPLRLNADFDVEVPSEEERVMVQYLCDCGVEMTISRPLCSNPNKRITLDIDGAKLHLILGKTQEKWQEKFENDPDLWHMPLEELLDGTLEIQESIWYWLIDGRCYETNEEVD